MPSWDKRFMALATVLLLFDGIWTFLLAPRLLHGPALSDELVYETDGNTRETLAGPQVYSRFVEIHGMAAMESLSGKDRLEFKTTVYKLPANELSWSQVNAVEFDRGTLRIAGSDAYLVFPPHVERRDYLVKFFSYLPDSGALFRFRGVDRMRGVTTYVFDYAVDGLDWTDNYSLAMPPGVRIKSRDWGTVWIEPVTGILVNHKEQWVAVAEGGEFDNAVVDTGGMWFPNDTVAKQLFLAQNMRRATMLYERILPVCMLGVGAILLAMAAARRRTAEQGG